MDWNSNSHSKYLLQYHLIFVCKYRKKLFTQNISDDAKQLSYEMCKKHNVKIKTIYVSYLEIPQKLSIKALLERTHIFYGWIFCVYRRKCCRTATATIYRKPRIKMENNILEWQV